MQIQEIFPTPIAQCEVDLPSLDEIEWQYESHLTQSQSNLHELDPYKELAKQITKNCEDFASKIGYNSGKLFITQMWANKYKPGQSIHSHNHANSFLSGVVYFDDNSPTVLIRSLADHDGISVPISMNTQFTAERYFVPAQKGRMLIFRSKQIHVSEPSDKERITISFNVLPIELGAIDAFNYVKIR